MSATDELRRLLDERGVEYFTDDDERAYDEPARTTWDFVLCGYEMTVTVTEFVDIDGKTYLEMDFHHAFTPEQAIAATLGESDEGCYLMRDGKKFPVELDYGFVGIMPIAITVAGFRYLLEVPNGE